MAGTAKNKLAYWSGSRPVVESEYQGIIKGTMHRLNLLPPPGEKHDWRKEVPRWALLVGLLLASMLIGFLASQLETSKDRQLQHLEQAYIDAPNKFVARLSERVAITETEVAALKVMNGQILAALEAQKQATTENTIQLKILTAEMRQRR